MIELLEWDTRFFGLKIGKAEMVYSTVEQLLVIEKQKALDRYDLVYLFVTHMEDPAIEWVNSNRVELVDTKLTFEKVINEHPSDPIPRIESYTGPVTPKLLELAVQSGQYSRFKKDPRLNPHFIEMYHIWLEKSVEGKLADVVLVALDGDVLNGFVTVKKDDSKGIVGLIAVDEAVRGKGIGKELLLAVENWGRSNNCNVISINTQEENSGACNFYRKTGYIVAKSQYVYHF
jgi:dTDP-4-amino-4,6-dideoxy-D-galactose acyltransferase